MTDAKVPRGGLRPGWWMNDLTQLMNEDDAQLARRHLPWYRRSGPGILPLAICGGCVGLAVAAFGVGPPTLFIIAGVLVGPLILFLGTELGLYNRQAKRAANAAATRAKAMNERSG